MDLYSIQPREASIISGIGSIDENTDPSASHTPDWPNQKKWWDMPMIPAANESMAVRYAARRADSLVTNPSITNSSAAVATAKNSNMPSTHICTTNQRQ